MPLWERLKFSKPQGAPIEIAKEFYLSVLISKSAMPSPRMVASPKGEHGAMTAFIAPLTSGKDKALLDQPMSRGAYVVASPDQKTVLQCLVMAADESGFDPGPLLSSPAGQALDSEVRSRISATWFLVQLTFESFDPSVYPSLDLLLNLAQRLAELGEGVVADPLASRYLLPHQMRLGQRADQRVDAREHLSVTASGGQVRTQGFTKFRLPELALADVPPELESPAGSLLLGVAQQVLLTGPLEIGMQIQTPAGALLVTHSPLTAGQPTLELLSSDKTSWETLFRQISDS